jgi:multiple sugar transport system substrate-binding protein
MRSSKRPQRFLAVAAVAVAVVAGSVACSTDSPASGGAPNLSLMIWDPAQKEGVQKAVDEFEAANPDIHVSLEQVPQDQYYTKLDASLSAGQGPDVMWQSSKAVDYVNGGALQSLSEYITRDNLSLDAYPKEITDLYQFDGQQYGIPKDQDAWTFVYNADVFTKLGVTDVPTSNWTWADMTRIAEEIKAKQSSPASVPMYYNYTFNNGVASLIHALGGDVLKDGKASVSSTDGPKAMDMIKDLQDRGLIPKVADSADFNPVSSLISGDLAMAEIPSWNLSLLSKADVPSGTFHVVRMPSVDGSWTTDTNGLAYVMNANSPQKDAAWKLIEFLTSDRGAALHAEGGAGLPANTTDTVQSAFVKANDTLTGLGEALSATRDQSYLRTSSQYPKTRASMSKIDSSVMGPFYAGSMSAADAAKAIDDTLDQAVR